MTLHVKNFGCQVLSCSTERLGSLVWLKEFGEAEISKLDITTFINKYVLGLEISMHNFVGVQVSQSKQNLCCNKLDLGFWKSFLDTKVIEDVTSLDKFKEKVNSEVVLEDILHR